MIKKLKEILSSIRFWIITFGWLAAYLATIEQNGFQLTDLFSQIALWLGTIAGVRTIDKFSSKN